MAEDLAYNRLRWICSQRSMHEMDVILGEFMDKHYPQLNPAQVAAFTKLADMEDIDLWPLVAGRKACDDPALVEILVMLRDVRLT